MSLDTTMKTKLLIPALFSIIVSSCLPENGLEVTVSSDQTPAVSPDGESIAYYHLNLMSPEQKDYPTGLYVMDKYGNNRRLLLEGHHFQPDWSPDGKWLVFSSSGILQIISFEGDSIRTFEGINELPLFSPDWSHNREYIIFSSPYIDGGGGFICKQDFSNLKQIYDHYELNAYPAKWYENSQIVCCLYSSSWKSEEIFIVDTLLVNQTRLTFNSKSDRDPTFSPTSNLLAWSSDAEIYIMDTDGSNQKRLDFGQYPAWTPDGKFVIYSNTNEDVSKEVLWKIDINGKNKTQLTF
ncbi:MAG: hypothetical protein ACP5E3_20450 [Bacteroidales bacterium]